MAGRGAEIVVVPEGEPVADAIDERGNVLDRASPACKLEHLSERLDAASPRGAVTSGPSRDRECRAERPWRR